jgi:RNA polymerase sigma-70 factor, ECF subfamily
LHPIAIRCPELHGGGFQRRASFDEDRRPGELSGAVARAQAGDREAFGYLYLRFSPNVYGYACSIVRNEHEAEDVTQQVFTRVLTALGGYEERGGPFSAWILRVTHNMAIDHVRRRLVLCDETAVPAAPDDGRGRELGAALRQALAELPEAQRQVLLMRHVGGQSPREIARALARSEDSVHALHHRGRRALRRALTALEAVPATRSS